MPEQRGTKQRANRAPKEKPDFYAPKVERPSKNHVPIPYPPVHFELITNAQTVARRIGGLFFGTSRSIHQAAICFIGDVSKYLKILELRKGDDIVQATTVDVGDDGVCNFTLNEPFEIEPLVAYTLHVRLVNTAPTEKAETPTPTAELLVTLEVS